MLSVGHTSAECPNAEVRIKYVNKLHGNYDKSNLKYDKKNLNVKITSLKLPITRVCEGSEDAAQ